MALPRIGVQGSLAERAYEVLKEAIVNKQLPPHQLLNEERLAEELGISRTPLRAALQKLQFEHLIKAVPGRGYTVASLSRSDMEHVFFMRKILEPVAARLAAKHRTDHHVKQLIENVALQRQAVPGGQYLTYLRLDGEFHLGIAAIPENPYLKTAIATVQLHGHRFLVLAEAVRDRAISSLDEHEAIALAIEVGDGDRAERLMRGHVEKTETMLAEVLPG